VIPEGLFLLDAEADLRRRPDVAFLSAERWALDRPVPQVGDWPVAPDLAVEVTSPNDIYGKVLGKVDEYFEHEVRQVWVIEPTELKVYVYDSPTNVRILGHADQLETGLVPGFTLKLGELFQKVS
jgi:Uma2 family endonuclease